MFFSPDFCDTCQDANGTTNNYQEQFGVRESRPAM